MQSTQASSSWRCHLQRRRAVIVRTTDAGEALETARIVNDANRCREQRVPRRASAPEVVLEATYGWYWAVDALAERARAVHLAHPLGVKAFEYRRVKNDVRDATDLADLLRMGRLPEAWIAPPATRELRELVRHRAKLVGSAVGLQGAGARGAGQVRRPGADVATCSGSPASACWTGRRCRRRTWPGWARCGG